ncbi:adenylate kinase isoenzyme 6-like [Stylonychia lemnae]|uniref:Adenylate kinase isoenzyme 6 homolog n=1 Tax=Stylonychia lemnae TaxID=5949 RepID=A0A078AES6_STYLE|nr:adenylate kinase isoenzyme 6-like [Stylonychia lemnae]|eukprot:CDW80735.1 adenylate kinase isoenzyme 6-like [Stylonychia lemnae]
MEPGQIILPNILVTGTPGVGKTSLCTLLENQLAEEYDLKGFQYVKLTDLIQQKKLYKKWNEEFDVPEFDEDMVCDELEPLMSQQGGIILEFHSCDFFPERWFQLVVLLRCNNTELFDRLQARGYNEKKITENIECEILDVLKEEVDSSYKQEVILELQSEKIEDMQQNLEAIAARIKQLVGNQ